MDGPDLFTVKVFKVPNIETLENSNSTDQEKPNHHNYFNGLQFIEELHNMTSARVIRGNMVEIQHSNLAGQSVKFKTILNFERVLEQGCSLGVLLTPQDGYITKPDIDENV